MSIIISCEHCGATLKLRDDARGKKVKCPKCQSVARIAAERLADAGTGDDDSAFLGSVETVAAQEPSKVDRASASPTLRKEAAPRIEPGADEKDLERKLMTARPAVRVVVLVLLLVPIVLASRLSVVERLLSCFVPLMLTGTYRISTIRGDKFATRFFFAFYPVVTRRCKLPGVVALNVKYGHVGSGMGTFLLFGPAQMIFGRIFDFLMPAIGGPYQIHLVTAKGRELVAWQGFGDAEFQSTLDLLIGLTNAEVRSV